MVQYTISTESTVSTIHCMIHQSNDQVLEQEILSSVM